MRRSALAITSAAVVFFALPANRDARAQLGPTREVFAVTGGAALERLGSTVRPIGDLNADGHPDFAVAAPGWGPAGSDSTGRVLIYFGGRRSTWTPDLVLTGTQRGAQFGYALAGLGDVNRDGFDDLLVSAPGQTIPGFSAGSRSGRVLVYFGGPRPDAVPDWILDSPAIPMSVGYAMFFGECVAGLGDTNGDGIPDWSVSCDRGTVYQFGAVFHYLGGDGPPFTLAGWDVSQNGTARALCGVGDVNGDGLNDLAIAYPQLRTGGSSVMIALGHLDTGVNTTGARYSSSTSIGYGSTLAAAGDLNEDGYADLLIGQPRSGGGDVFVWWGGLTSPNVAAIAFSTPRPDSFASALSIGYPDDWGGPTLLVGACGDDAAGAGAGRVFLYHLTPSLAWTQIRNVAGPVASTFGAQAAFVGDVDGNGEDDLVVGAPRDPVAGAGAGSAQLFTLSPHTLLDPAGPGEFVAGRSGTIHWLGALPARVALSLDEGATWPVFRDGAGGFAENFATLSIPDTVTARARVRVSLSGSFGTAATSDVSDFAVSIVRKHEPLPCALRERERFAARPTSGRLGAALAGGRDFDGDGTPDAFLGVPFADAAGPNSGAVWKVAGGVGLPAPLEQAGDRGGDRFGSAIALGGDADGDGIADLLIGAPGAFGSRGAARLRLGGGGVSRDLGGAEAGDAFGSAVAWIGRFDGEAGADFAVGSPFASPPPGTNAGTGRVSVFFGRADPSTMPTLEIDAPPGVVDFGQALAGLDLNHDGWDDLVVSAQATSAGIGIVYVYYGGPQPDGDADLFLARGLPGDRFGETLANVGDVNGDGTEDLAVGAPGFAGGTGSVDVYLSGAPPARTPARHLEGAAPGDEFGAAICAAGDLDGDGVTDLLVGAPGAGGGTGLMRFFFGGTELVAGGERDGEQPGERFGAALAGAGDSDGDGLREFLIGAPLHTYPGSSATGRVVRLDAPRYAIDEPAPGARWFAGGAYLVKWRGAEPAEVALSLDAGRTWQVIDPDAGDAPSHTLPIVAPSVATDSAYLRLRAVRPRRPLSEILAGPIAIDRSVAVNRFDFTLDDSGIRLRWETTPGLGPDGLRAYRIERLKAGDPGPPEPVTPGPIGESELLVRDFARGVSYVLVGVDGNGEDLELARVTVPAVANPFRVWPVPSGEFGDLEMSVFPPVDGNGRTASDFAVTVYDLNGRVVRRLATGVRGTRVGEVRLSWDRSVARGGRAGAGVYFVRAESPAGGFRMDRRVVILR